MLSGMAKKRWDVKLSFRKFKGIDEDKEDKKLWQFIEKGATSPDDYHSWDDYLRFDKVMIVSFAKRVDDSITYLPAVEKGESPKLVPKLFVPESIANPEGRIIFRKGGRSG